MVTVASKRHLKTITQRSRGQGDLPEAFFSTKKAPQGAQGTFNWVQRVANSDPQGPPKRPTGTEPHPRWTFINTWQEWYMLHIGGGLVTPYFNDLRRLRLDPSLPRYGRFLTSFWILF